MKNPIVLFASPIWLQHRHSLEKKCMFPKGSPQNELALPIHLYCFVHRWGIFRLSDLWWGLLWTTRPALHLKWLSQCVQRGPKYLGKAPNLSTDMTLYIPYGSKLFKSFHKICFHYRFAQSSDMDNRRNGDFVMTSPSILAMKWHFQIKHRERNTAIVN